jgi:hypothetical protein
MELVLVFVIFIGLALYLILGYKGSKESKNKPDQLK